MKQYMPLKPVKRGFKVWVLADATNGYVSNLQVYTGKSAEMSEDGLRWISCEKSMYRYTAKVNKIHVSWMTCTQFPLFSLLDITAYTSTIFFPVPSC